MHPTHPTAMPPYSTVSSYYHGNQYGAADNRQYYTSATTEQLSPNVQYPSNTYPINGQYSATSGSYGVTAHQEEVGMSGGSLGFDNPESQTTTSYYGEYSK